MLDDNNPRVATARAAEARLYQDYDLTPRHAYVAVGETGMRIRVSVVGSGPPILFVPGNTGDAFPLIPMMAAMPGRQIVAVNRPGGGLSDGMDYRTVEIRSFAVEVLETIIDTLNLGQTDIVAHSIGAHWSVWLAMDRPQLVRRLVTLGNPGNVMGGGVPLALRLMGRPPLSWIVRKLLAPKKPSANLRLLRMMGHDPAALERLPISFAECYAAFRQLPNYVVSATSLLANAAPAITAEDLATVSQPVLLQWGTEDSFASPELGQKIADALPDGKLQPIEGAGHLPWIEETTLCGRSALNFLCP